MDKQEVLRHSAAHILAAAVKQLFPKVKLGIGPAIETGFYYDFDKKTPFTPEDLKKIEGKMHSIINKNQKFKKITKTKEEAKKLLKDEPLKLDLLKEIDKPVFYQNDDFIDLCAGPHIKSTGEIKAFKLLKVSGAYWKGDSKNKQLQRIYGVAFTTKKELEKYLKHLEEAEKRNHIKLGKQLHLFSMHPEAPGFPFWHPKGTIIYKELENFWTELHLKRNYKLIKTPIILSKELWIKSGHWDHYKDSMYFTKIDNREFAVKPMNCPGGILVYKENLHSYKEFPLRIGELGLVHRHELSGVLNGLFRVRSFIQDDAHVYCTEKQIEDEVIDMINLTDELYKPFKLKYEVELSTMPKKHIGSAEMWKKAEKHLEDALKKNKIKYKINKGDGAFYGPKIDFHVRDSLERTWQCGTIQLDFAMPEKFKLSYDGEDGKKHTPVLLHRALLGSFERFIGILIEHFGGKFPTWMSPIQVRILTITDKNKKFAEKVYKELKEEGIRVELDTRSETIPKKVREAQLQKIPMIIVIGDKEEKTKTMSVRTLNGKTTHGIKVKDFMEKVKDNIQKRLVDISFR